MDMIPAPKKQDGKLSVQYMRFSGIMEFFYDGEKIYTKTVKECEEMFPHILWWEIEKNEYQRYVL